MSISNNGVTLLGLGPGNPGSLTLEAWRTLENIDEVYLRTRQHPSVAGFPKHLVLHDFDYLYEQADSFDQVYADIIHRVMELARRPEGVVYAVPGHPFIAEATSPEIARLARQEGIPIRIVDGLSFIEPVFSALGIDPFPRQYLADALDVARKHVPPFAPDAPALIAQLYSRDVAADVKLTLMEWYPDNQAVQLVHAAGTRQEKVENLFLYEIDRSSEIGLLTVLYVPSLSPASSFEAFQEVIAHLRAPDGCPWDREQTHSSLRPYLLEETYEVLAALDANDVNSLREELGDLLLQIVIHAQIAAEEGDFTMADVLENVNNKLVYRHPHVFGDVEVEGVEHVLANWEKLKATEREKNGKDKSGILDGIPMTLPALVQADQYQDRAARTGFEWPEITNVIDKILEELDEVQVAATPDAKAAEIGDLIFAVVNLSRSYQVEPESALREANLRFRSRFEFIERKVRESGFNFADLTLTQMLDYWQQAKKALSHP